MFKIPSYNQWMTNTSFPSQHAELKNQIGALIREINSPRIFPERLDRLIELQKLCQKSLRFPEIGRDLTALNQQVTGVLTVMLNAKGDNDLNKKIQDREAMKAIDFYYIPGNEPEGTKVTAGSAREYKQKRLAAKLIEYSKGALKLETMDEKILRNMRVKKAKGKEVFEQYVAELKAHNALEAHEHYFQDIEREAFRALPSGGLLYKQNLSGNGDNCTFEFEPFNTKDSRHLMWQGEVIYALGSRGEMFIYPSISAEQGGPWDKSTHHTSAFAGEAIICAGTIETDQNGMIRHIDYSSGHYQPTPQNLLRALNTLKERGVIYKSTDVHLTGVNAQKTELSLHEWNLAYHNVNSAKNDVKKCFSSNFFKKDNKHVKNDIADILQNVESCRSAEEVCRFMYIKYISEMSKKTELTTAMKMSLCQLLNIREGDFKNDQEFNRLLNTKMKSLVNFEFTREMLHTVENLSAYKDKAERGLASFKYVLLSKEKEESKILYARDAITCIARKIELPNYSMAPYNISESEWKKNQN